MRTPLLMAAVLAGLSACAQAAEPPPAAGARPAMDVRYDVPSDSAAQRVDVMTRDIPPGGEVPWHTHPGVEIAYVESGEMELRMQGRPPRRLKAGDSFMAPRGVVHGGANVGTVPARLVITYVVDRDAPLRSPAEPPED